MPAVCAQTTVAHRAHVQAVIQAMVSGGNALTLPTESLRAPPPLLPHEYEYGYEPPPLSSSGYAKGPHHSIGSSYHAHELRNEIGSHFSYDGALPPASPLRPLSSAAARSPGLSARRADDWRSRG